MLFVLLSLILQCTNDTDCNVARAASIFGIHRTIALGPIVLDISLLLGNKLRHVMFSFTDHTTISFGHFLYGILWESHIVRSLSVLTNLSTCTSRFSAPTISR